MSWSPAGDRIAYFARTEKQKTLILQNVVTRKIEKRFELKTVDMPESPDISPDGKRGRLLGAAATPSATSSSSTSRPAQITQPHERRVRRLRADVLARRQVARLPGARQRQRQAVPPRPRDRQEDAAHLRHARRRRRAVPGRRHARVPVDGGRSEPADRPRGRAQRQHLQHLDAEPEDRRAEAVHRHARAATSRRSSCATRRRRRSPSSPTTRASTASTRCRAKEPLHTVATRRLRRARADHRLPAAAQPHAGEGEHPARKGTFEKLFLEGRPPVNVGVTSGGDLFGGTQVTFTDVLGDKQFNFFAASVVAVPHDVVLVH